MPTTKNEKLFLAYSLIFGVLAGLCLFAILQAIAIPSTSDLLLSAQEHRDFTLLAAKVNHVQYFINIGIGGGLAYLLLLLPVLNPNINLSLFKQPRKITRLTVYVFAALLLTIGLSMRLDSFFGNMNSSLFMRIIGVAIPIVWWSILGEIGIAGDLSSWKPKHRPDIRTCILLAITTYFFFTILSLADNWGFSWFLTLVAEVLDGSGEMSLAGFTWLQGGIIVLSTCTSLALSATIIALAPIRQELQVRTDKLLLPIGLTIGFSLLLCTGYYYGAYNYDLDKADLSEAIGAKAVSPTPNVHTAVLLGDAIASKSWQTDITTLSMTSSATLTASEENIQLLEQYLTNNPQSIHRYSSEDALVKSLFNLWDSTRATISQQQTQNNIFQRIIFLNRLSCLPITAENHRLLLEYEDDSKWRVGTKAALLLARAAIHFNDFDKAGAWLEIAKEQAATAKALGAVTIPEQPQLTHGEIVGSVNTERPVIIGLFRAGNEEQEVELNTTYLTLHLVDSRSLANSSTFSFSDIGKGRYFLALRYAGESGGVTMAESRVIELNNDQPKVDVGLISLGL